MGFLDAIFKRNSELEFLFDFELFQNESMRLHMKKLAIEICITFLGRTISQSEFRVRNGTEFEKNELYYRLNIRPNKNQTASTFWQTVIRKLVYDNECLIIQADDGDLLIADDFQHHRYAVYEDYFSNIMVRDFKFDRTYKQNEVIHLKYSNEKMSTMIDSLFKDYGDLFGRIFNSQKRKSQVRATVNMDTLTAKNEEKQKELQTFIDNMYKAFEEKDFAIVPQQPGFEYSEKTSGTNGGQGVDEINKVTDGFLDQVAMVMGLPIGLVRGDLADVEKQTKNYMLYTISPLLKKITDEANVKFFSKEEYLAGKLIDVRKVSYLDIFDLSNAVDKLRASGVVNGNEIRKELGLEKVDDPIMEAYFITKNYVESTQALQGGESE